MSASRDASALLGALLDRMGAAQGQALLARLDKWLASAEHQPNTKGLDQDQVRAIQGQYDRRQQDGNVSHTRHSNSASIDAKG